MINDVLVFAKKRPGLERALAILRRHTEKVTLLLGDRTDSFPQQAYDLHPDLTISYLSGWIIPPQVLSNTHRWAINFHPGPPEYPGIGCSNFALYNGETQFGVTAHLMEPKVDSGRIIAVRRFPIAPDETVLSLTQKAYEALEVVFDDVIDCLFTHERLPESDETWRRRPYTRRELEELCRVDPSMPPPEIQRRVHAVAYPNMPGAYVELHGCRFEYNPER